MIGFGWVRTHFGDVFLESIQNILVVLGWIFGKMDQKRKIWAIAGVLRSDEETPRSGEGPRIGEGSPRRNKAEREGWPGLGFVATKPLFTT